MLLALLFLYFMINMFRMLIHPSSGACDLFVELFHGLYCSGSMCVDVTLWFGWGGVVPGCWLKHWTCTTSPDQVTLEGSSCTSIMTCTGGCGYSF